MSKIHSDSVKRIDITEFREFGFLQEANRQFFHPLGLALEIVQDKCSQCRGNGLLAGSILSAKACVLCGGAGFTERLGGVWDYRDDPEGMVFGDGMIEPEKAQRVKEEKRRHLAARLDLFDGTIQPVPDA